MREIHVSTGVGEKSVRLSKDGGEYVLAFVLHFNHHDPATQEQFRAYARAASEALGGQPVRVELCDQWMVPKAKLPAMRAAGPRR